MQPKLSLVIIGRNLGSSLSLCLESVQSIQYPSDLEIIYIDTSSKDDSLKRAMAAGVITKKITPLNPCAAVARNTGWKMAKYDFVFFLDGDTLLDGNFLNTAMEKFKDQKVAAVFGQRRERYPEDSIYQRVLDIDWINPNEHPIAFGGDVIIRKNVLEQLHGYDESLIAGEDPELSYRIQSLGYKIIRLDIPMTMHDLNIHHFKQYWMRCYRTGYAYAMVSNLYKESQYPLWQKESRHNLIKGFIETAGIALSIAMLPWTLWPTLLCLVLILGLVARTSATMLKKTHSVYTAVLYGLHAHFQHLPMFFGQLAYLYRQTFSNPARLIEYH